MGRTTISNMKTRKLGNTDLDLTVLGLGTGQLGGFQRHVPLSTLRSVQVLPTSTLHRIMGMGVLNIA